MGAALSRIAKMFAKKEMRILMVGPDAAGKTIILSKLKFGEVVTTIPTLAFDVEIVDYKHVGFTIWNVGGQDKPRLILTPNSIEKPRRFIRLLWKYYYQNIQGVIYVIDSNDREIIAEARDDFHKILNKDELSDAPVLVIANKQNLPNAMPVAEITDKLGLRSLSYHRWFIQAACATTGEGLYEGLNWLTSNISN